MKRDICFMLWLSSNQICKTRWLLITLKLYKSWFRSWQWTSHHESCLILPMDSWTNWTTFKTMRPKFQLNKELVATRTPALNPEQLSQFAKNKDVRLCFTHSNFLFTPLPIMHSLHIKFRWLFTKPINPMTFGQDMLKIGIPNFSQNWHHFPQ